MQPTKPQDINTVPLSSLEQWSGYWRTLSDRKKRLHDVSTEQIILGQIFTLFVTMGAGFFVSKNAEALLLIGTSLLLYPVIAESLSSNAAVMVARLHHEIDSVEGSKLWFTVKALGNSIFIAVAVCLFLGVMGGTVGALLLQASFYETVRLAVLAGLATGIVGLPLMAIVLFITRRLQANPDDVAPPIETTVFNSLALFSIIIISRLLS